MRTPPGWSCQNGQNSNYYQLEYLFRNGSIDKSYKAARFHLLTAFRHLAAPEAVPNMASNQVKKYADKLNAHLWSRSDSLRLFETATKAIDVAVAGAGAELDKDLVRTQPFTDAVLKAVEDPGQLSCSDN